ncbi:MAG: divergent polysaccharide deacetylase family protein [Pseudomonadota bacterium]
MAFGAGTIWHSWRAGTPSSDLPLFEESVHKETSPIGKSGPSAERPSPAREKLPLVAIVIDDLGYQKQLAWNFINLDLPLTLSFLPQAPFAQEMARQALQKGKETWLHLPMEPKNYPKTDPGPGALLISMSGNEIQRILQKDLEAFPGVTGVNNHMGSRFTEDPDKMTLVLKMIKGRNLFFLDSRTSRDSVGLSVAARLGIKAIGRDIFLDNVQEEEAIQQQLDQLIRLGQEHGLAVGCGHPYPQTLRAIKEKIPVLQDKVRLVPLSGLL